MPYGSLLVKFLGVHLISHKLSINHCMPLIQKIIHILNAGLLDFYLLLVGNNSLGPSYLLFDLIGLTILFFQKWFISICRVSSLYFFEREISLKRAGQRWFGMICAGPKMKGV